MGTRSTLVAANSQHLPEDRWFVMGLPSMLIFTLKLCVSDILDGRCVRIVFTSFEDNADRARRFCRASQSSKLDRKGNSCSYLWIP